MAIPVRPSAPPSRPARPLGAPGIDPRADEEADDAPSAGPPIAGSGPCRLTVASTPAGSIVKLDDRAMGSSPITLQGSCDKHKVEISHARYQSQTRWVAFVAPTADSDPGQLQIALPRPIHAVTVASSPPGAELWIDGRRVGNTPTVAQIMGFAKVSLTLIKPGFQTVTQKIYSKLAQDRVLVTLTK
jgi:hypothetical protein